MGLTLQHAGVSITVTSITDFVAFAIGASTVLPALQSFCIYAALGVFATYIFQATFFVAWMVLDQERIEAGRNAFLICYTHKNYTPNKCSQKNFAQLFFEKIYSKILFKKTTKVIVFLVTFALLGVNIWGNTELRQEFNPIWFLPQDSYLFQYFSARDRYFPERGEQGFILLQNVSLPLNLDKVDSLVQEFEKSPHIYELEAWYSDFKRYIKTHFKKDIPKDSLTDKEFNKYLGRFLYSPLGSKYRGRLKFNGNLTCGSPSPEVLISNIGFKFKVLKGPEEQIPVMNEVKSIVKNVHFSPSDSSRSFVWSFAFAGWETDEIITSEVYRNMALAMICVLITTLILIANFSTCIMVLTCVVFTLVNVGGSMHFWNLTIDTVSCIDLVIAIGLSVDYAAHIGHAFMTCTGSRDERARKALINIGPAVLNGGFSTFLAFVLLANSKSHVFITFFKIFFLVVVYGLFHGLVFFPVLLSVIGPPPYVSAKDTSDTETIEHMESNVPLNLILTKSSSVLEVRNGSLLSPLENGATLSDEYEA